MLLYPKVLILSSGSVREEKGRQKESPPVQALLYLLLHIPFTFPPATQE